MAGLSVRDVMRSSVIRGAWSRAVVQESDYDASWVNPRQGVSGGPGADPGLAGVPQLAWELLSVPSDELKRWSG